MKNMKFVEVETCELPCVECFWGGALGIIGVITIT